ncbi:hypothetical protein ABIC56_002523 [Acinetobacter bereziniae]|nr:hypothetical protein [Acinetobacter bereziniae]
MTKLSYIQANDAAWLTFLEQIERVSPYLEHLKQHIEILKKTQKSSYRRCTDCHG